MILNINVQDRAVDCPKCSAVLKTYIFIYVSPDFLCNIFNILITRATKPLNQKNKKEKKRKTQICLMDNDKYMYM